MSTTRQHRDDEPVRGGHESRGSAAFLVAQLGAFAAERFADRVAEIGLTPALVGILRAISRDPGCSQRQLATRLGLLPSRMVAFVDDLESRSLVERERSTTDRRQYSLHLTPGGRSMVRRIGALARAHERDLCRGLGDVERATLVDLLGRIGEEHGLTPGVHPGYRHLRT